MSDNEVVYTLIRLPTQRPVGQEGYTLGSLYRNGLFFAFTCEDEDRRLEDGGTKVPARTAIPRGRYRLTVSQSPRFKRRLPEVKDVPQFKGIRFHGGNKAEDSEGCVLIGQVRTAIGVAKCADTVNKLIDQIDVAEKAGKSVWLEVK